MKRKLLALLLASVMVLSLVACGQKETPDTPETPDDQEEVKDYSGYTIRIYSNSNSTERTTWLIQEAKDAGFTISIDDNSVISGDTAAIQAANENKDGDILFGLNETRWSQVVDGVYENLKLVDWTPTWAGEVGEYAYPGAAYGLVIQNVLMLYRNDELGTNGEKLHFQHWADIVDCGYTWYRQNKVGGTTNANINSAMLYAFVDPSSPAGGISTEGWETLWKYCAEGKYSSDDTYKYGFDPLNKGDVAVSTFYSSSLYGKIDAAAESSEHPLKGAMTPENWDTLRSTTAPITSPSTSASSIRLAAPRKRPRLSRRSPSGSALPRRRRPGARSSTPIPATPPRLTSSIPTASPPSTPSRISL